MKQEMKAYTATDQWVWNTLFVRQEKQLKNFACIEYLQALKRMYPVLNAHSIPDFEKINNWFENSTGWQIEVVAGLIPVDDFFELLAEKRFCSSTWLRKPEELDYLEEPDMFHDIFGHIPLLSDPAFSNFAQEFGKLGVKFKGNNEALIALQRLYWFTIEFGIIREKSLKIYGAGIMSSYGETPRSVSNELKHTPFDIEDVIQKSFRTDVMQEEYVVIDSFEQLSKSLTWFEKHFIAMTKQPKALSSV